MPGLGPCLYRVTSLDARQTRSTCWPTEDETSGYTLQQRSCPRRSWVCRFENPLYREPPAGLEDVYTLSPCLQTTTITILRRLQSTPATATPSRCWFLGVAGEDHSTGRAPTSQRGCMKELMQRPRYSCGSVALHLRSFCAHGNRTLKSFGR